MSFVRANKVIWDYDKEADEFITDYLIKYAEGLIPLLDGMINDDKNNFVQELDEDSIDAKIIARSKI